MLNQMTTQFDNQDSNRLADQVAYDPNNLLDSLIEKLHLKNGDKYVANVTFDGRIVFQKLKEQEDGRLSGTNQ